MSNNKNSKTVLTAPNPKRIGAFLIDQLVLYVVFAIYFTVLGVSPDKPATALIYLGAVILTFAYRILYPIFVSRGDKVGQTLGKRAMGIKTISANGADITIRQLFIRSLFMMVVEGFEIFGLSYLLSSIALFGFPQIIYLNYMNVVIGIVSIAIMFIRPSHQALHDYVSNTVVILVKQ